LRSFIAAFLPEEIKDALFCYVRSFRGSVQGIKWERREKFHVTIRFLGDVQESRLEDISKDIDSMVHGLGHIETKLGGLCVFPSSKNPRVLALGLATNERFQSLFYKVQNAVIKNGFDMEKRKFIPHVTIGRVRGNFGGVTKIPKLDGIEFSITSIGIVKSELGPQGSSYTTLRTWDIKDSI